MSGQPQPEAHDVVPGGEPIMTAKLRIPPLPPWVVKRPRLYERISRGVDGPLTLLSAPAGSGKTVLASAWVAAGVPARFTAWVSLDEGDDRPGVFWSYVLGALARTGVAVS